MQGFRRVSIPAVFPRRRKTGIQRIRSHPVFPGGRLSLPVTELFRHLVVFGSTGSGKTRYILLPLLRQLLELNATDPGRRAGALIFDVKGDMPAHVERVMKLAGREDSVLTLGRNGTCWFDPFASDRQDSRGAAERLIEFIHGAAFHEPEGASRIPLILLM